MTIAETGITTSAEARPTSGVEGWTRIPLGGLYEGRGGRKAKAAITTDHRGSLWRLSTYGTNVPTFHWTAGDMQWSCSV